MGWAEGNTMSRYSNPNSKRKQKSRAKREAQELCTYHTKTAIQGGSDAILCVTPEEFIHLEAQERFIPQEETVIKRKRRHRVPKQLSAAA